MEQRTTEWDQARLGKVTASRVADVVAKTKSGYAASRANYMAQLLTERLTGVKAESFTSKEMQWGTDNEPQARAAYVFYRDLDVEEVGFVDHPTIGMAGASPDGRVGTDGLVEIKCPNTATHIETLLGQKVPERYVTQMLWQMACTRSAWCDFASFDPRMPVSMQLFVHRIHRDEGRIVELEQEIAAFLHELDAKIEALSAQYAPPLMAAG